MVKSKLLSRIRGVALLLAQTMFIFLLSVSVSYSGDNLFAGMRVYEQYCVGCHGEKGDGKGIGADDLIVKPRDFTKGIFKFKSTMPGSLPTDKDLKRVITNGLPLTSMPAFRLLPDAEKDAVIAYIKSFSNRWDKEEAGKPLEIVSVPDFLGSPESVDKGKALFSIRCAVCHGGGGKGDGPAGRSLKDRWGNPVKPANFTYGIINRGPRVEDIYKSITLGIDGTPMPAFANILSDEDRWHITSYILKLMGKIE